MTPERVAGWFGPAPAGQLNRCPQCVAMMRSRPPQATIPPATVILNRLDARTMPCQVCVLSTLVSEADTIHTPAIKKSRKATSATFTPLLWEKAISLKFR